MEQGNSPQPFSFSSRKRVRIRKMVPDHVDEIARWIGLALWLRDQKDDAPEQLRQIRREIDSLGKAVQKAAERLNGLSPGALQALQRGGLDMDWLFATQELKRASERLTGRINETGQALSLIRRPRGHPRGPIWRFALLDGLASIWERATGSPCSGPTLKEFVDEVIEPLRAQEGLQDDTSGGSLSHDAVEHVLRDATKRNTTG